MMGLFSNKNKPCPLCGSATPRLFSTKIDGEPLCSDCADAIMADQELVNGWNLEEVKQHLAYRAQNQELVDSFPETRSLDYGDELIIDDGGKRFYVKHLSESNPPIFRFDEIKGFEMEFGWHTVETWSRGMQRTPYQPPQLGALGALASLAEVFVDDKDDKDSESETIKVTLKLSNPYITEYELVNTSVYGQSNTEFNRELAMEMSRINAVCNTIVALASEQPVPAAPAASSSAPGDATDEIMKYKRLLDAGAITQAEFAAKKKQLLGL